jgi:PAS domain-containing protein
MHAGIIMKRTLSKLLSEIARQATSANETVLSHLCKMAALEAQDKTIEIPRLTGNAIGIWDWDVTTDCNHLDSGCAELFGVDRKAAQVGMPTSAYLQVVHPDDVHLVSNAILHALKDGGIYEAEYRVVVGDRVRRVFAKGSCTLDKSRRAERFPGVILELPDSMH